MQKFKGFFDLAVNESALKANPEQVIASYYNYGYRTIAINYNLDEDEQKEKNASSAKGKKNKRKQPGDTANDSQWDLPKIATYHFQKKYQDLTILNRLTIHLASREFYSWVIRRPTFKDFDLLAIVPLNHTILQTVCNELELDIFAMNFYYKSNFRVLRKHYNQLVARGVHVEVPYAPVIGSDSCRSQVIMNAHSYHTVGRSRNVIVSSNINLAHHIRGPYDVINLGLLFGLSHAQAKAAISQNAHMACLHGVSRSLGKIPFVVESKGEGKKITPMEICKQPTVATASMSSTAESADKTQDVIIINDSIIEASDSVPMLISTSTKKEERRISLDDISVIEIPDDSEFSMISDTSFVDEVSDVGHQLKKIKT